MSDKPKLTLERELVYGKYDPTLKPPDTSHIARAMQLFCDPVSGQLASMNARQMKLMMTVADLIKADRVETRAHAFEEAIDRVDSLHHAAGPQHRPCEQCRILDIAVAELKGMK